MGIICYGNGICVDKFMDYICDCFGDRIGIYCEYQFSLCQVDNVCVNEEVCIFFVDIGKLVCVNEFYFVDLIFKVGIEMEEEELIIKIIQVVF